MNILVLSKNKTTNKTQFIDASGIFKKETNNNVLTDEHIAEILKLFSYKADVDYLVKMVDNQTIASNDYNLAVSSYVEAKDTREIINITELNAELRETVAKIDRLRAEIDKIIEEIEV